MRRMSETGAKASIDTAASVDVAIERVRQVYGRWRRNTPVAQMRNDWDELFWSDAVPADTQYARIADLETLWVSADADPGRVLVYLHGGGFKVGSVRSHRDLMARISREAGCRVLGVNYRLAPEHRFPAPVQDIVAVYEWLLANGILPRRVAFAGDSAGAGLAASAVLALRERGQALPAAVVMLSAWTDLTAESESYTTRAALDPIHQRPMILATASNYLGDANPRQPMASPLFGDLSGLPPVLLQVGGRETVLDDSTRFAAKARAAGVKVELEIYDDMIHVFQQFPGLLPEAQQAIASIGRFLCRIWDGEVKE
jgi:monoterpene epsilon-lactone hydrolase